MAQSAFEEVATDQFGIASHKAEMQNPKICIHFKNNSAFTINLKGKLCFGKFSIQDF